MFKQVKSLEFVQNFEILKILVVPHRELFNQIFSEL